MGLCDFHRSATSRENGSVRRLGFRVLELKVGESCWTSQDLGLLSVCGLSSSLKDFHVGLGSRVRMACGVVGHTYGAIPGLRLRPDLWLLDLKSIGFALGGAGVRSQVLRSPRVLGDLSQNHSEKTLRGFKVSSQSQSPNLEGLVASSGFSPRG